MAATTSSKKPPPRGIRQGWFTETEAMWPGQKFSLALEGFSDEAILFHQQSEFQSVLVFRSAQYGNVLVLDEVIQLTERDEFSYHEMMTHLPLCAHRNPKRILIVGGGDGGILREVCKHDTVTEILVVEIDPMVLQVAKQFFGESTATHFDDPRVTIVHADAAQYISRHDGHWDVILGDTSDPVGPAESLFQPQFYESMYQALSTGGIVCVQAECFWIHLELIGDLVACCADIFDHAEYCSTMVPTYPCGQIGFILATKHHGSCRRPVRSPSRGELKWYSRAMHQAAFVLPLFVTKELNAVLNKPDYGEGGFEQRDCWLENAPCAIL